MKINSTLRFETLSSEFESLFKSVIKKIIKIYQKKIPKIIYIDMDGIVSSDFRKVIENCRLKYISQYKGRLDRIPDIYKDLEPIEGATRA